MKTLRLESAVDSITFDIDTVTTIQGAKITIKEFRVSSYRPRLGIQSRYGKSGGVATGDREVDPRELSLMVDLTTEEGDDYSYMKSLDVLLGFFIPENGPFYIYDDQDDSSTGSVLPRRALIELKEENLTAQIGLERRVMSGELKFVMLDGMWEDASANTYDSDTGGIVDGETFNITNSSKRRAYPVYTLTALSNNTLFKLSNTTSDVFMEVGTSDFTIGSDCVIDTVNGTIKINGVNIVATSLSDGSSFPDLLPGINTLKYDSSSGSAVIGVTWRERYPR